MAHRLFAPAVHCGSALDLIREVLTVASRSACCGEVNLLRPPWEAEACVQIARSRLDVAPQGLRPGWRLEPSQGGPRNLHPGSTIFPRPPLRTLQASFSLRSDISQTYLLHLQGWHRLHIGGEGTSHFTSDTLHPARYTLPLLVIPHQPTTHSQATRQQPLPHTRRARRKQQLRQGAKAADTHPMCRGPSSASCPTPPCTPSPAI